MKVPSFTTVLVVRIGTLVPVLTAGRFA